MLIPDKTKLMLQQAYTEEQNAHKLYKNLAVICNRKGLFGAAKYFKHEAGEELSHSEKIEEFLNNMGSWAESVNIMKSEVKPESLMDALEAAYDAEKNLLEKYEKWFNIEENAAAAIFLQDMVNIQVKSVGEYADWIQRLKLLKNDFLLDQELGA